MSIRSGSIRRVFGCLAVAIGLLLIVARADAAESPSHPFIEEFSAAEGMVSTPDGGLEDPCGVAFDSQGDLYVSDYYHDTIDVFASDHHYLTHISGESLGNGPCALALDPASGDVYVNNWRQDVVKFTPSAYPPTPSTTYGSGEVIDSSGTATGLALDPASGNLYVDDGTYIAEYEPSGLPVEVGGHPLHVGTLGEGFGLAVSAFPGAGAQPATAGDLYVPDAATGTVKVYDPALDTENPVAVIDGAGTPQGGFNDLIDSAVAIDPTDGHVFVLDNVGQGHSEHPEAVLDEFNPSGAYRGQIGRWITHPPGEPGVIVEHSLIDAEPSGLAIGSTGNVYVTSENSDGSESGALDRNGKPLKAALLYAFGPTSPAQTLTVAKTGAGVGTVKSEPAGIDCGTACAAEYDLGAKVTLTATPDPHSAFSGWTGGGCSGTPTCKVTISAAQSLSAEFAAIPQQALTVAKTGSGEGTVTSEPAGISCPSACSEHFNQGSTVLLTAEPAPHNRLASWTGECIPAEYPNAPNECAVQMSVAKSIEAQFEPIPQQTLTVKTSGEGVVTSAPAGIECGTTCSEHFDEGATLTLTATPALHNQVAWSGCSAEPSPTRCEVALSEAKSVSATFSPILHGLTVSVLGSGSVSASSGGVAGCTSSGSGCSGPYQEGEAITLTAAPAPGSTFAGWSGDCAGAGPCHLTIGAESAVTANFAPLPPLPIPAQLRLGKLTVSGAGATLKLSVSGPGTVLASASALKRATATASAAGPLTLSLVLSGSGRRALAKHRRLEVQTTLTFSPSDGGASATVTKTITFKAARRNSKPKPHSKRRRH